MAASETPGGGSARRAPEPRRRDVADADATMCSYLAAFGPGMEWDELPLWPPDLFVLANLVLDHTEALRYVVAPPAGRRWPPTSNWSEQVRAAADAWREAMERHPVVVPPLVAELWEVVTRDRDVPMTALRHGELQDATEALLTLHAIADEACSGLAAPRSPASPASFERRAWRLLDQHGSLCHLSPTRVRVTPKTHFANRGITIRSLSRYLAVMYESVDIGWRRIEATVPPQPSEATGHDFNIVLVPWPLRVESDSFRSFEGPVAMDPKAFGFFQFAPLAHLDVAHLERVLDAARSRAERIDAVILPETAIAESDVAVLEELVAERRVPLLIAGVRGGITPEGFGRNYVHFAVLTTDGWRRYHQDKHQRWCLDEGQIRQYHLSRPLSPGRRWWEAINLPPRTLEIVDVGSGRTTAPLICEDLARFDEVGDVVRRIGPSLVVALLLDGPQLTSRWPSRYASVLADEPGCAVLTLTAFGMVTRSRPPGKKASRVVALWADPASGRHELELGPGASAILLTVAVGSKTVWTADGRRHDKHNPTLTFAGVRQIKVGGAAMAGRGEPRAERSHEQEVRGE